MNLRMFSDERGHWYIRGLGYSGNGATPEEAMRDLVMHHNSHEANWPVRAKRDPVGPLPAIRRQDIEALIAEWLEDVAAERRHNSGAFFAGGTDMKEACAKELADVLALLAVDAREQEKLNVSLHDAEVSQVRTDEVPQHEHVPQRTVSATDIDLAIACAIGDQNCPQAAIDAIQAARAAVKALLAVDPRTAQENSK